MIGFVIVVKIIHLLAQVLYYVLSSMTGSSSEVLDFVCFFFELFSNAAILLLLILVSVGWSIVSSELPSLEWKKTVWIMVLLMVGSDYLLKTCTDILSSCMSYTLTLV